MDRPAARASLRGRLAWAACGLTCALVAINLYIGPQTVGHALPALLEFSWWEALSPFSAIGFALIGAVIVARRPANALGWLACAIGVLNAAYITAQSYAAYSLYLHPGSLLPGGHWAAWFRAWSWYPAANLMLIGLPLLFPDGRLPSRRWSPLVWLTLAITSLYCAITGLATEPVSVALPDWLIRGDRAAAGITQAGSFVVAAVAAANRYRSASSAVRQQIKWLAAAAMLLAVLWIGALIPARLERVPPYRAGVFEILIPIALLGLPLAIGIAVLRHRLYDIDLVIGRAIVYGTLAAFIAVTYLALVVGAGLLIGSGGRFNLLLSVLATAVIAVVFQPVRSRVERLAARMVFGRARSPYDALADLSREIAAAASIEEVLAAIAAAVGRGARAQSARVLLRLPGGGARIAAWPAGAAPDGATARVSVGLLEPIGELEVTMPPGEALGSSEMRLISAIAAQSELAFRNLKLAAELSDRLEELAASRTRIVHAEEAGRRRLERDLHDGVQQQLVALIARLRLARNQIPRDPGRAESQLGDVQIDAQQVLVNLRELARGIHPAVLGSKGLVEAVEGMVSRLPIGVRIEAGPSVRDVRYAEEIEGAAYFTISEGLANVLKHSGASEVRVSISRSDAGLALEVTDNGRGFSSNGLQHAGLQGLRDRVEALGGSLEIATGPGGTRLAATLPALSRDDG